MKITNKFNLPDVILTAVQNDSYTKGNSKYSATDLIKTPRQFWLKERHFSEIEIDVSDEIWKLLGTGIHSVLENAENLGKQLQIVRSRIERIKDLYSVGNIEEISSILAEEDESIITEKRYHARLGSIVISGQVDNMKNGIITDYKVTSVYKIMHNDFTEWKQQLNVYAWLLRIAEIKVDKIQIIAILKDWNKRKSLVVKDYPKIPISIIELELWDSIKQTKFVLSKIESLEKAESLDDKELPLCTFKDKWQDPPRYAIRKEGNKKASKIFDNKEEAENFCAGKDYQIEIRKSEPTRCLYYCEVRNFCNQFKKENLTQIDMETSDIADSFPLPEIKENPQKDIEPLSEIEADIQLDVNNKESNVEDKTSKEKDTLDSINDIFKECGL